MLLKFCLKYYSCANGNFLIIIAVQGLIVFKFISFVLPCFLGERLYNV